MTRMLFGPHHGMILGLLRLVLIGFIVLWRLPERFFLFDWSNGLPQEFMNKGLWLSVSPIPIPLPDNLTTVYYLCIKNLGWAAAFGICTRPALILFTICYGHMLALESAWGWHDHGPSLVLQVLLVMCVAPGITACSIDRLVYGYFKKKPSFEFVLNPQIPRYGMQLVLVLVVLFYTSAGVSKLRYGGLQWLNGNTLSFYLSGKSQSNQMQQFGALPNPDQTLTWKDGVGLSHYLYGAKPSAWGKWVSEQPLLCSIGSISAVGLELIAPLTLLGGRFRTIFFLGTGLFHIGIYLLMGIPFFTWVVLDVFLALYRPK